MAKENARLSIDVAPAIRTRLKIAATRRGITLRDYCLEAIRARLESERELEVRAEANSWAQLSVRAFARDWSSEEDAVYDEVS